ncbi:hypothetical protein DXU85_27610, partial [Pseudomonas savastanoi]
MRRGASHDSRDHRSSRSSELPPRSWTP